MSATTTSLTTTGFETCCTATPSRDVSIALPEVASVLAAVETLSKVSAETAVVCTIVKRAVTSRLAGLRYRSSTHAGNWHCSSVAKRDARSSRACVLNVETSPAMVMPIVTTSAWTSTIVWPCASGDVGGAASRSGDEELAVSPSPMPEPKARSRNAMTAPQDLVRLSNGTAKIRGVLVFFSNPVPVDVTVCLEPGG